MAPRRLRQIRPAVVVLALALCAASAGLGCAQSAEFDESAKSEAKPVAKPTAKKVTMPTWVTAGFELGQREINKRRPLTRPGRNGEFAASELPTKPEFVALLLASGVNQKSAECIYDSISTGPVAENAIKLINVLQDSPENTRGEAAADTVGALDQGEIQQFLVAVAPCMDAQTLVALLAAVGGKSAGGGSPLDAIGTLAALSPTTLAALVAAAGTAPPGSDIATIAAIAGVSLTPAQIQALTGVLAASLVGGSVNPKAVDFDKLDMANLGPEGVAQILFALAVGLSETQRQQLVTVANVDLSKINLELDPDKINSDQGGALLVLLLPFISAGVAPPPGGPPVGSDPGGVYIPPGTDLSSLNPLYFVKRENLIAGLMADGVEENVAGCMYDKLRTIDPRMLSALFNGTFSSGTSEAFLTVFGCAISRG